MTRKTALESLTRPRLRRNTGTPRGIAAPAAVYVAGLVTASAACSQHTQDR